MRSDKNYGLGVKHDSEKRKWSLLLWREVGQVVDVLCYGAIKYAPDSWKHVPDGEVRYFEAAIRHITARFRGEIRDRESKLPHLAHAVCCLLFWLWFDNTKKRGGR